ncbi:MAG: hypothetical protein ABIN79_08100 [Marmoricola sp.]
MRGGYGTSDHGTLADRHPGTTSSATAQSPARHCLVDREPSLLVEWRQGAVGWEGRVISMIWIDASGWATVERWLPVGDITPL